MKIFKIISFFILLFLINPVLCENIIIKDNIGIDNKNSFFVYENEVYIGTYNYTDNINLSDNTNYTIIINEKFIDIINKKHFLSIILIEYGYIIISLLGIIILIGFMIYVYNKTKGK